ncbi:hypothetical protein [Gilliamella sp. wkB171]|uniref:hypothetical protein n=1 Tax=Gilliamella sp. wkB171 TaxID=3120258 RepID=UPI000812C41B|nr:hypothetical protein [Gilliamella apicola]OCL28419.1 hypothetical protein A9G03_02005 [Gilliamella apicola]
MSNNNIQIINNIEAKLAQTQSMVKVVLDKPFMEHCDTGNLLWVIGDLIEDAYKELLKIDFKGGDNNG